MSGLETLTDESLALEVKNSGVPLLVEFWAEFCAPCVALEPVLNELASEHAGKLRVGRVNIEEETAVTEQFSVKSVPTMILFKDGVPVKRMFGAKGKRQLAEELRDLID